MVPNVYLSSLIWQQVHARCGDNESGADIFVPGGKSPMRSTILSCYELPQPNVYRKSKAQIHTRLPPLQSLVQSQRSPEYVSSRPVGQTTTA